MVNMQEIVLDGELFSRGVFPLVPTDSLLLSFKSQPGFHGLFMTTRVSAGLGVL